MNAQPHPQLTSFLMHAPNPFIMYMRGPYVLLDEELSFLPRQGLGGGGAPDDEAAEAEAAKSSSCRHHRVSRWGICMTKHIHTTLARTHI